VEIRAVSDDRLPAFSISLPDSNLTTLIFCARNATECEEWVAHLTSGDRLNAHMQPKEVKLTNSPSLSALQLPRDAQLSVGNILETKDKWAEEFTKFYQRCDYHGYLQRKRRISGKWGREYYFMAGSSIYSFKNHLSPPNKPQAEIFTCTASGIAFPCQQEFGISEKRKFVFSIKNPNAIWILAADTEEDMNNWLKAIRQSVQPINRSFSSSSQLNSSGSSDMTPSRTPRDFSRVTAASPVPSAPRTPLNPPASPRHLHTKDRTYGNTPPSQNSILASPAFTRPVSAPAPPGSPAAPTMPPTALTPVSAVRKALNNLVSPLSRHSSTAPPPPLPEN
jgi:hypothetical protein